MWLDKLKKNRETEIPSGEVTASKLQWLDISSAPKDGTIILLLRHTGRVKWTGVGPSNLAIGHWKDNDWRSFRTEDNDLRPTHWCPIPQDNPYEKGETV